jgi:hypothetical protein
VAGTVGGGQRYSNWDTGTEVTRTQSQRVMDTDTAGNGHRCKAVRKVE